MDMAHSLLKSMNVLGRFWGEAVRHVVYLLNRLPTKAMDSRTLFEAWYGKKPYVGHLRAFGCTAHAKVTTPHMEKLDYRSHMMVYLGVEDGSKAHHLYNPRQNKIHISRDVKFEENVEWNWNAGATFGEPSEFIFETTPSQAALLKVPKSSNGVATIGTSDDRIDADDQVAPGSVVRSQNATRMASATMTTPPILPTTSERRTSVSDSIGTALSETLPLLVGGDESHDGPVRYRNIDDIMRDTRLVELEKEFA